jgi:hypothetical protein
MGLLEKAADQTEKFLLGKPKELKYRHFARLAYERMQSLEEKSPSEVVVSFKRNKHMGYPANFFKGVAGLLLSADGYLGLDLAASYERSHEEKVVGMNYHTSPVWRKDYIHFVFNRAVAVPVQHYGINQLVEIEIDTATSEQPPLRLAA